MKKEDNPWFGQREKLAGHKDGTLEIETDPQGDAQRSREKTDPEAPRGVKVVGGGQHGKVERGVKRVSRRGTE